MKHERNPRRAARFSRRLPPDPDNWQAQRGCLQKRRVYSDRKAAHRAARQATKLNGVEFGFYRCRFCKDFHLTTVKVEAPVIVPAGTLTVSSPTLRHLDGTSVRQMVKRG
jgi:hypothetical protein